MKIRMSWVLLPVMFCFVGLAVLGISVSASSSQEAAAAGDDKVKALEKQLAEATKQIKTLGDDKKKLTDSLTKESDKTKSLEKQLADAVKQVKTLTDAASKHADVVKSLQKQVADAQKQNKVLSEKLASAGKGDADKIKALEKDLADALKKTKPLTDEKTKAIDLAAACAKDLQAKDKLLVEAQQENKAIAEAKARLEKGRLIDTALIKKLGVEVVNEQKKNVVLAAEKKQVETALDATAGTLAQTSKSLASEKTATAKLTAVNKKLQGVLTQTDKKLQDTNERLDFTYAAYSLEKTRAEKAEALVALLQCELASRCRIVNLLRGGNSSRSTFVPLCPK